MRTEFAKKSFVSFVAAASLFLSPTVQAQTDDPSSLMEDGKVGLSFRYRLETVDDAAFGDDAEASTVRSRLQFQSGKYRGWSFNVEFDDVRELLFDDFNAGAGNTPSRTAFPTVADPEGTDLNQAYVDFAPTDTVTYRFGRQRILLDNQRFVGGVGWRQNEQTYDGVSARFDVSGVTGSATWVENVNRIFGDDVAAGDHEQGGTILLNAGTNFENVGKVSGYYYRIDNDDAPAQSSQTLGARLSGTQDGGAMPLRYVAEVAWQDDVGNNPQSYNASYYNLELGTTIDIFDVAVGWAVLTGDAGNPGEQFRTPLATLHAFQGWADKFLAGGLGNPSAGIEDLHVKVDAKFSEKITGQLRYHTFEAEDGGGDYGDEIDLRFGYTFSPKFRGDVFYANFDGDALTDTEKFWLMVTFSL